MIFRKLRLIYKNQKGVTLPELVVALAIVGLIAGITTMVIFQVFTGNISASNHMTAVRQVQNAGYWISHDTQMAQSVVPAADPDGFPLSLSWTGWYGDTHTATYTIKNEEIWRNYDGQRSRVAQYVDSANCEFTDGALVFTVTATVGTQSETRVYEVIPRPST